MEDTGFDSKFMQTGKLGNGIYFSKSAEYAERHYAHNMANDDGTPSATYTLFLSYVLFPAATQSQSKKSRGDDTLFAIQDKAQAYPMYLIYYESGTPIKKN